MLGNFGLSSQNGGMFWDWIFGWHDMFFSLHRSMYWILIFMLPMTRFFQSLFSMCQGSTLIPSWGVSSYTNVPTMIYELLYTRYRVYPVESYCIYKKEMWNLLYLFWIWFLFWGKGCISAFSRHLSLFYGKNCHFPHPFQKSRRSAAVEVAETWFGELSDVPMKWLPFSSWW